MMVWQTLMNRLSGYWRRYSRNEQWVWVGLAAASVFVVYLTQVWQPLADAQRSAESSVQELERDLAWLQAASRRLPGGSGILENAVSRTAEPRQLTTAVNELVRKHDLSLNRFEQDAGNRLRVWLDSQPFDAVVLWLADLQQQNIAVRQIVMGRAASPGQVTVRAELEAM